MTPAQVNALVGNILQLRQITGQEQSAAASRNIDQQNVNLRAQEAGAKAQAEARKAQQLTLGTPIEMNGSRVLPIMQGGTVVQLQDIGNDPNKFKPVPLIGKDGQVFYHDVTQPVPDGAQPYVDPGTTALRDATKALTESNVVENESQKIGTLAKYKSWVMSDELKYEDKKAWADAYNAMSTTDQFVEEDDPVWFDRGRKKYVLQPKANSPADPPPTVPPTVPREPKSQEEFNSWPSGTKFINPADGKVYIKK